VYYAASRRIVALIERPWLYGLLYGVALYLLMNLIVVPLSAAPKTPFVPSWVLGSIAVHLAIGVVTALSVRAARGARVAAGAYEG